MWQSHPEGMAGSIDPGKYCYVCPMGRISSFGYDYKGSLTVRPNFGQKLNNMEVLVGPGSAWARFFFELE